MSMTLLLYLSSVADSLRSACTIFAIIYLGITAGICFFSFMILDDCFQNSTRDYVLGVKKSLVSKLWIPFICVVLNVFTPNKETMYLMMGTNMLSNTELPTKVTEALELKLDDVINELKKNKNNG